MGIISSGSRRKARTSTASAPWSEEFSYAHALHRKFGVAVVVGVGVAVAVGVVVAVAVAVVVGVAVAVAVVVAVAVAVVVAVGVVVTTSNRLVACFSLKE